MFCQAILNDLKFKFGLYPNCLLFAGLMACLSENPWSRKRWAGISSSLNCYTELVPWIAKWIWRSSLVLKPDGNFMISDNVNNPQVLFAFEVNRLSRPRSLFWTVSFRGLDTCLGWVNSWMKIFCLAVSKMCFSPPSRFPPFSSIVECSTLWQQPKWKAFHSDHWCHFGRSFPIG